MWLAWKEPLRNLHILGLHWFAGQGPVRRAAWDTMQTSSADGKGGLSPLVHPQRACLRSYWWTASWHNRPKIIEQPRLEGMLGSHLKQAGRRSVFLLLGLFSNHIKKVVSEHESDSSVTYFILRHKSVDQAIQWNYLQISACGVVKASLNPHLLCLFDT